MYWYIVAGWSVLGLAVFWGILTTRWDAKVQASGGVYMWDSVVSMANKMHGFAVQPNYLNFKMSVLRHTVAFGLSAVILNFVISIPWCSIAIVALNLTYAFLAYYRYREYKAEANSSGAIGVELKKIVDDAVVVVYHAVISAFLLLALMWLYPL